MILTFLIICTPLLLMLSVAVVQLTKAIQILFLGKERLCNHFSVNSSGPFSLN
jgi:hypothetical protein